MIYEVVIPTSLTVVPWLLVRYVFTTKASATAPYLKYAPYLWVAAILWLVALIAPNVPLTAESDTTSMHTLGGVAAGVLWLYCLKVYNIRFRSWWQAPLSIFFFVCGLGVLNELLEVFMNTTGIAVVYNGDAQWDLVADVIGGGLVYAAYVLRTLWQR